MAHVQIAAGITADIATPGEVKTAVDASVNDGIGRLLERLPSPDRGARLRPIASVNPGAAGNFVLNLGQPSPGCIWMLVEVCVTGPDDRTAVATTSAALYAGIPGRQSGAATVSDIPPLGNLIRPGIAVPGTFQFSGEPMFIKDSEALTVMVYTGATVVATLSAVATVMQLEDTAVSWNRSPGRR